MLTFMLSYNEKVKAETSPIEAKYEYVIRFGIRMILKSWNIVTITLSPSMYNMLNIKIEF